MKHKYLLIILFSIYISKTYSQADFDLVKMFNTNGNVYTNEKIWLQDNTFLVPILFNTQNYTLENNIIIPNPNFQPGQISQKILIARYNDNAQLVDYFTLNSMGYELLDNIHVDKQDNIYITYSVPAGYQLEGQTYFANVPQAVTKYMMLKISKGGSILWKKTFEDGALMMFNLAVGNNGDVFMTARAGQQNIKVDGITYENPTPHQTQTALTRMVVGKLNTNGNGMLWLNSSTNSVTEAFGSIFIFNNRQQIIRLDSQNNVYFAGNLWGMKATFGNTTLQNIAMNKEKLFLVKYNSNGQQQWVKSPTIATNSYNITSHQFEIDDQDNLFLLEQYHPGFYGNQTVNYWGGVSYTTNKALSTIIKMNTDGNIVWMKNPQSLNSGSSNMCNLMYFSIINGKILAFGLFNGNFDYGNGIQINTNDTMKWVSLELNNNGGIDNYNVLDVSNVVAPLGLIGKDNQNKLWFAQKTATSGNFNLFIGTLNYNLTIGNATQKLIYYRSASVTLNEKEFETLNFTIYPNPAYKIINVSGKDLSNKSFQIFNLSGQLIKFGKLENSTINIEDINVGTYILKIFNNDNSYIHKTVKFIKN